MFQSKLLRGLPPEVTIDDIEPEVFYQILRFIYTGRVPLEILNTMAAALFIAARKYKLEELESEVRKYLFRSMSPDDCAELLLRSSLISNDDLKKVAKIFWRYPNQVLESTTWQMTSKENGDLTKAVLLFLVNTK
jgi:speckle-type POZ protein